MPPRSVPGAADAHVFSVVASPAIQIRADLREGFRVRAVARAGEPDIAHRHAATSSASSSSLKASASSVAARPCSTGASFATEKPGAFASAFPCVSRGNVRSEIQSGWQESRLWSAASSRAAGSGLRRDRHHAGSPRGLFGLRSGRVTRAGGSRWGRRGRCGGTAAHADPGAGGPDPDGNLYPERQRGRCDE